MVLPSLSLSLSLYVCIGLVHAVALWSIQHGTIMNHYVLMRRKLHSHLWPAVEHSCQLSLSSHLRRRVFCDRLRSFPCVCVKDRKTDIQTPSSSDVNPCPCPCHCMSLLTSLPSGLFFVYRLYKQKLCNWLMHLCTQFCSVFTSLVCCINWRRQVMDVILDICLLECWLMRMMLFYWPHLLILCIKCCGWACAVRWLCKWLWC